MKKIKPDSTETPECPIRRIFISAVNQPDGNGAAVAWLDETTGKRGAAVMPGSTPVEAAYSCCRSVFERIRAGQSVQIVTDLALLSGQFHALSPVCGHRVHALRARIVMVVRQRRLEVDVVCVPRADNRAWKLLKHHRVGPLEQDQLELDFGAAAAK
jgi:hypothetical protein